MRSYYGQRCGTAVDLGPEFPGYRYEACHRTPAPRRRRASSGTGGPSAGWHDAGDYGRYVVNSGITTGTLLWAYELHGPRLEDLRLDIPESANDVPDLLDEVRWNLEWMLTMQDADGGVWHKQTSERFCGFVMPEKDDAPALGHRHRPRAVQELLRHRRLHRGDGHRRARVPARSTLPSPGSACAPRARGWAWLEKHPDVVFRNPQGVVTGRVR